MFESQTTTIIDPRKNTVNNGLNSERIDYYANCVASKLHEKWRMEYKAVNGDVPRIKPVHNDKGEVVGECDINRSYEELPSEYKLENYNCAVQALRSVNALGLHNSFNTNDLKYLASEIHDAWLQRNASWAPAELRVPYSELPKVEQQKDVVIAVLVLQEIKSRRVD